VNVYLSLAVVFLVVFVGVSADCVRIYRRNRRATVVWIDEREAEQASVSRIEAEAEREHSTGATFNDQIDRKVSSHSIFPLKCENITSVGRDFIADHTPLVIICPPTFEGLIGAALLKRSFDWAEVRVMNKNYFVKSLWTFTRMSPRPEFLFIVGADAGYVHGRRLVQTLNSLHESGLRVAWYDNHSWLPIIARNIGHICHDFIIAETGVTVGHLVHKRFAHFLDQEADRIVNLTDDLDPENTALDTWSKEWGALLRHALEQRNNNRCAKLVKRLANLSPIRPLDRVSLFDYARKVKLSNQILEQQRHIMVLPRGVRMSVIDLRPLHREKSFEGTSWFVFRGKRPSQDIHKKAFKQHNADLVLIIRSLLQCDLYRSENSDLKLTRLIDITMINDRPVRIEGHDEHCVIAFDLPLITRLMATLSFRWPADITAFCRKIQERLT